MHPPLNFSTFIGTCTIICCFGLSTTVVLWPVVYFTIGRKFDILFKDKAETLFGLGPLTRAMWYAGGIAFLSRWKSHKSFYYMIFKDYDFWDKATTSNRILSWVFIGTGIIGIIFMIPSFSAHIYNYWTVT